MKVLLLAFLVLSCELFKEREDRPQGPSLPEIIPIQGQTIKLTPNMTFYWQLQNKIRPHAEYNVNDVDLFDTPTETFTEMKRLGIIPACYFSLHFEDFRPDKHDFPLEAIGEPLDDWPGERIVDIRHPKILEVMKNRLIMCKNKGGLIVEGDNQDQKSKKFKITDNDVVYFMVKLSEEAHKLGLAIIQKNNVELVDKLEPYLDAVLAESCHKYKECDGYKRYADNGKMVIVVEYEAKYCKPIPYAKVYLANKDLNGSVWKECK